MKHIKITKTKMLKKLVLSLFLLTGLVACDEFLNTTPLDEISEVTFFQTKEHLDLYARGLYDYLPNLGSNSVYAPGGNGNDDFARVGGYSTWLNGEKITENGAGKNGWSWSDIRKINYFLDNYESVDDNFDSYKHYVGEVQFFKALRYYGKVKSFGDVPWYDHYLTDSEEDREDLYKPRDSRAEVVGKIMDLLDEAVANLNSAGDKTRLNKESALILKSRIALHEASWAKYHAGTPSASDVNANEYFQIVIDTYNELKTMLGGYSSYIHANYAELFNSSSAYKGNKEIMLARDFDLALGKKNGLHWRPQRGYDGYGYTLSFVQSYLDKDGNTIDITDETLFPGKGNAWLTLLSEELDPRYKQMVFVPGEPLASTGPNHILSSGDPELFDVPTVAFSNSGYRSATGFEPKKGFDVDIINDGSVSIDMPIYRVGEILLNYAEAYVELNGSFPDMSDNLDLLRTRAGMPTLTSVKPVVDGTWPDYGYTISDELAIIRQERRIELIGEVSRTDDWKRWRAHALFAGQEGRQLGYKVDTQEIEDIAGDNTSILKINADGYLDIYRDAVPEGYDFDPGRDYLSAIPLQDIVRNPALDQNPGWDTPN